MSTLTQGQQIVGLTFNPSNNETVHKVKQLSADILDILSVEKENLDIRLLNTEKFTEDELETLLRKSSFISEAMNHALTAQMWAVKAITHNP